MVSVCMATYNGEKYIHEQLESILQQIASDDEVVISDDGSTDATCAIIEAFQDKRIRLLHNDVHNHKWNFQYALQHAKGDVVFLADQDDVWLQGRYQCALQALKTCNLVMLDSIVTDENLQPILPSFFAHYHSGTGIVKNILLCTYFGSHMAFDRKVLEAAVPFPTSKNVFHDGWIGVVAEVIGKVQFVHTPTMYYRRNPQAPTDIYSNIFTRSKRSFFSKIAARFDFTYQLLIFCKNYFHK